MREIDPLNPLASSPLITPVLIEALDTRKRQTVQSSEPRPETDKVRCTKRVKIGTNRRSSQGHPTRGQPPAPSDNMTGSSARTRNPARRVPFPLYEDRVESMAPSTSSASTTSFLPSNHFLAQRPISPDYHASEQSRTWDDSGVPDTSSLAAADFDVSVETGFLPPEEPVQSIEYLGNGWNEMEECLRQAGKEVDGISGGGVGKMSQHFRDSVKNVSL